MYGLSSGYVESRDWRSERWTEDLSFDFGAVDILLVGEELGG